MAAQRIKYAELEALYEMIITRKTGSKTHFKYAAIKNGKTVTVSAKEFFRLEKMIDKKQLTKLLDEL